MKPGNMGERQRWAWIAAGLSAAVAAAVCGISWVWVLLGGTVVTLYYIYMDKNIRPCGAAALLTVQWGPLGKLLAVLALGWTVLAMGWTALLADGAFPMVDGFPALGWILLLLTAVGCRKGPGACARCAGVLCLFLAPLYGSVTGFALPDIKWENLRPVGSWQDAIPAAGIFLLSGAVWYLPCRRSRKGAAWELLLILPIYGTILAAVTAGVLTPELAAELPAPLYTLTQSVSLFGVVERIEPLLSAAMTMGVFCLLSVQACACGALGRALKLGNWGGPAACAGACGTMFLARKLPLLAIAVGGGVFWFILPLLVVVGTGVRHKV